MTRRRALTEILASMKLSEQELAISARQRLIGVWRLLRIEVLVSGDVVYPYGEHPVGRLTYDEAGRTSAQVMRPGRKSSVTDPARVSLASEVELRQIADGYVGYYGRFTLDGKTLIHHIEACTLPAWVGTDQKRQYEFIGSQLALTFGASRLVWERALD